MSYHKLATILSENTCHSYENCKYILKTYVHLTLSVLLILGISYIFGIVKWSMIILFTGMILRALSGGAHSKSKIICTVISLLITIGGGIQINYFKNINSGFILSLLILIFVLGYIDLLIYAPADTPQKPIISNEFKKQLKIGSLIFISMIEVLDILLYFTNYIYFSQTSIAFLIGVSWQLFTITPFGYILLEKIDNCT